MKKLYKMVFMTSLITGTLISVSSYTWLGAWMGLEINLLSFIPMMSEVNNPMSTEASIKYFLTQAMASTMFLFSTSLMLINTNMISEVYNNQMSVMMNTSLLIKLGAAPFHSWFPQVMEGLSWMNCLILMTIQKVAPMILIMYSMKNPLLTATIIISAMVVGGLGGINQTKIKKILSFSSINHIGWMISASLISQATWIIYFSIYTMTTMVITTLMTPTNMTNIKQLTTLTKNNFMTNLMIMINFLSLGGLPPFLGFLPKWIIIQQMIQAKLTFIATTMVITTLMTLFFYLRMCFTMMIMTWNQMNWTNSMNIKNNWSKTTIIISAISITGLIASTYLLNFY
uniref:NADH-ubiquinone oxidoreductase chain 2 n=1 Tax=Tetraphalerus bruchi TaxID=546504 RepID=B6D8Y3_TETBR|nr:NADH dehydrogenase subunit 2 [Tetraphalerus bruchi]ACF35121.1 NADH dehydrogenase subunit 2 [Tetraphalerus bruchi]